MFKIGEIVVYGTAGVCTVEDITMLEMRDIPKEKKYYVLVPLSSKSNRIFAPVDNTKVPLRKIITKEEALNLIERIPILDDIQIENPKLTDVTYKEALKSCDVIMCARVLKTLYKNNKARVAQGKKVTAAGERYFKMAQDALFSELAVALSIDKNEVSAYIQDQIHVMV